MLFQYYHLFHQQFSWFLIFLVLHLVILTLNLPSLFSLCTALHILLPLFAFLFRSMLPLKFLCLSLFVCSVPSDFLKLVFVFPFSLMYYLSLIIVLCHFLIPLLLHINSWWFAFAVNVFISFMFLFSTWSSITFDFIYPTFYFFFNYSC